MKMLMVVFVVGGVIAWGAAALGLVGWKAALTAHLVGFGGVVILKVERKWSERGKSSKKSDLPEEDPENVISLDDARSKDVDEVPS